MSQKLRLITEYWTNNVKRNEYFINENDNREGKALSYYPSGKLKKVCYYSCDEENGLSITYHENGRISEMAEHDMGCLCGAYLKLDETGHVLKQGHYRYNQPVGIWFDSEEPKKVASHSGKTPGKNLSKTRV